MDFDQWRIIGDWTPELAEAALVTVRITALGFVLALALGTLFGIVRSRESWLSYPAAAYVEFFRGTPLLVQLFFIYYGLPQIGITLDAAATRTRRSRTRSARRCQRSAHDKTQQRDALERARPHHTRSFPMTSRTQASTAS